MKYIFKIFFLVLFVKSGFSQVQRIPYYNNLNFNNSFNIIAESDDKNNYFVVNLDVFGSSFEKAYFSDLCFKEPKIVRIDAGNDKIAWFKSKKLFTENDINAIFNNLKNQTISTASSMNDFQKQEWLNRRMK
jgi:hypothetical protein